LSAQQAAETLTYRQEEQKKGGGKPKMEGTHDPAVCLFALQHVFCPSDNNAFGRCPAAFTSSCHLEYNHP